MFGFNEIVFSLYRTSEKERVVAVMVAEVGNVIIPSVSIICGGLPQYLLLYNVRNPPHLSLVSTNALHPKLLTNCDLVIIVFLL